MKYRIVNVSPRITRFVDGMGKLIKINAQLGVKGFLLRWLEDVKRSVLVRGIIVKFVEWIRKLIEMIVLLLVMVWMSNIVVGVIL